MDNARDIVDSFQGLGDGPGGFGDEEIQIALPGGLFDLGGHLRGGGVFFDGAQKAFLLAQQVVDALEGFLQKTDVVADVLGGRVDLVGDAGGQMADGFQFLGLAKLDFHQPPFLLRLFLFGDVVAKRDQFRRAPGIIAFVEEIPIDCALVSGLGGQDHFIILHWAVAEEAQEFFHLAAFRAGIKQAPPVLADDFIGRAAGVFADGGVDKGGPARRGDAGDHGGGALDDFVNIISLLPQVLLGFFVLGDLELERLVGSLQGLRALGHEFLQAFEVAFGLVEQIPFFGQGVGQLPHLQHLKGLFEHQEPVGVAEALDDVMPGKIGVGGADDDLQIRAFPPDVINGFNPVPARFHAHVHERHGVGPPFG